MPDEVDQEPSRGLRRRTPEERVQTLLEQVKTSPYWHVGEVLYQALDGAYLAGCLDEVMGILANQPNLPPELIQAYAKLTTRQANR